MISKEDLLKNKIDLSSYSEHIGCGDIEVLIEWLNEKGDDIRYATFLLLQMLSQKDDRVYKHWDTFAEKLNHDNSYQRSLGIMLIAENIIWDKDEQFAKICSAYLEHCDDEKFVTARQCIQGLNKIISQTNRYRKEIIDRLIGIDLGKRKDTQKDFYCLISWKFSGISIKKKKMKKSKHS